MKNANPTEDEIIYAQDLGLNAFFHASISRNPYPIGSVLAAHWIKGYAFAAENQTGAVALIKKRKIR